MNPVQLPLWAEYVKALGAPIVALIAACIAGGIAYRQWKTARNKLKLDLFEKRLQIYNAAAVVVELINNPYAPDRDYLDESTGKFSGARWLFGRKVELYLNSLKENANLAYATKLHLQKVDSFIDADDEWARRVAKAKLATAQQMGKLDCVFREYLQLHH